MANPAYKTDPRTGAFADQPPISGADPMTVDPRIDAAKGNDPYAASPRVMVKQSNGASGILIAGAIIVLAIAAYVMFAPGSTTMTPSQPAVTSEPAAPAAPNAAAPMAPAESAAPAPDAAAPAPVETAPAGPAPTAPAQ